MVPATVVSAPSASTAQINARIAPDLKAQGDAALLKAGLSPTQAIRALWELAARHIGNPRAITDALFPDEADAAMLDAREKRRQRAIAIEQGPLIMRNAYESVGMPWPPTSNELSYGELKELAYRERYGDYMGWSE